MPLLKSQGLITFTFNQRCCGTINSGVYMKCLDYKQLNEIGEKVEMEELVGN